MENTERTKIIPSKTTFSRGVKIRQDMRLVIEGEPIELKRPWIDRLLSRPFQSTETVIPMIPDPNVYREGDVLFMHPATKARLKKQFA